jgi:hypothetical protein
MGRTHRHGRTWLLASFAASLLSCSTPSITGTWEWQYNRNPAGALITLMLATEGDSITGTGTQCGVGPGCYPGAITVTGEWSGTAPSFAMTIQGGGGYVATYNGAMVGDNGLSGTWWAENSSGTVVFNR